MKKVVLLALCLPGSLCAMQDISLQDLIANTARKNDWYIDWLYRWLDEKDNPENLNNPEDLEKYAFKQGCKLVERNNSLSTYLYDLEDTNPDEVLQELIVGEKNLKLCLNDFGLACCGIYDYEVLSALHTIKLENNELTHFPYELLTLPQLKNLDLWNNNISYIFDSFYVQGLCRQHEHLEEIRLSGNDLREFPSVLLLLPNLQKLNLARNEIEEIIWDDNFEENVDDSLLKEINLNYNVLTTFPYAFLCLKRLVSLLLLANKIYILIENEQEEQLCKDNKSLDVALLTDNPINQESLRVFNDAFGS